ncbi:hypothetical protein F511_30713 [Dorcoceras hygrometricum]|uniref:Uncharacterized protein n=1 Tax=Dorcoceras hygrometricum TaxID=472368 RepID=A0A2Z7B0U9_9LAMI|nr:hypothetical protein F511_30713 [Dorcoceras hygrometricum]
MDVLSSFRATVDYFHGVVRSPPVWQEVEFQRPQFPIDDSVDLGHVNVWPVVVGQCRVYDLCFGRILFVLGLLHDPQSNHGNLKTHTGKQYQPQRDMGSNPSTESNIKQLTVSNKYYANAMHEQLSTTEGYTQWQWLTDPSMEIRYGSYQLSLNSILARTETATTRHGYNRSELKGQNTYPNKLGRNANRLHKGDVLAHLTSFKQASKSSTKRSFLARGVQRYHSYFNRSCLPSTIEEDKVR